MALINCPECGKEIGNIAQSCPHCGRPMQISPNVNHNTQDILESFYIVGGILARTISARDIVYCDVESYLGILYQNNNCKPLCRINLGVKNKQILIPDKNKIFKRIYIDSLNDTYPYQDNLIEIAKRYLDK